MRIGSERFGTVRNGSGRSGVWRGVSATPIDPLLARTAAGDTDHPEVQFFIWGNRPGGTGVLATRRPQGAGRDRRVLEELAS